jgi:hypothetical protein
LVSPFGTPSSDSGWIRKIEAWETAARNSEITTVLINVMA